jgi:type II secretory pathway pseudopilin PulG
VIPNRRLSGLTLLELLVAAGILSIMIAATTRAMLVGFKTANSIESSRAVYESRAAFEDQVSDLIRRAWLSADTTETTSFYVGQVGAMTPGDNSPQPAGSPSSSSGASSPSTNSLTNSGNSDNLVFTTIGQQVPTQLLESADDWETANQDFGPQGGVAEVSLSTTAISDPGNHTGLFLRIQRPADTDPTQGGNEHVMNPDVAAIGFEFYDGTQWDPTWDTRTMATKRLPAAVRVTYRFTNDTVDHEFVVLLPLSDVTNLNPVTQ